MDAIQRNACRNMHQQTPMPLLSISLFITFTFSNIFSHISMSFIPTKSIHNHCQKKQVLSFLVQLPLLFKSHRNSVHEVAAAVDEFHCLSMDEPTCSPRTWYCTFHWDMECIVCNGWLKTWEDWENDSSMIGTGRRTTGSSWTFSLWARRLKVTIRASPDVDARGPQHRCDTAGVAPGVTVSSEWFT